jgi:predicted transposase YbfD/YdcC
MDYSRLAEALPQDEAGVLFDLGSLYGRCQSLTDTRAARGKRYPLALIVMNWVLAKLAGEDKAEGIAEWAKWRAAWLVESLQLKHAAMPHAETYRRLLGQVIAQAELEGLVVDFLRALPRDGWSVQICLDGKTLRGSIPAGATRGVHLLAAYVPGSGVVLCQVAVADKTNEIGAAPQLLQTLDLQGKIVTADALLTQRALAQQIVTAQGDYLFPVKDNQPKTRAAIEKLFAPQTPTPGHGRVATDLRSATTVNKGHGRIETRTLTVSSLLQPYLTDELDWPGAQQIYRLERTLHQVRSGQTQHEVVYGLTSLAATHADPARLLRLIRTQWAIESELHYRRDVVLREDATRCSKPRFAHVQALLNNLVLALVLQAGWDSLPAGRRFFAAHPEQAMRLLVKAPA